VKSYWFTKGVLAYLLTPVMLLYRFLVFIRRSLYQIGFLKSLPSPLPVIVVGNISVGGTGKTPVVIALVDKLRRAGLKPAIVSRGYGGVPQSKPLLLRSDTPVGLSGDEPALLAMQTSVPVCVCIQRSLAVQCIADETEADIVISDDGLQHYAMQRDVEIAVIDAERGLGNGWMLPAGFLREPPRRLLQTDLMVMQTVKDAKPVSESEVALMTKQRQPLSVPFGSFYLKIDAVRHLADGNQLHLNQFAGQTVHAVAGLGNPQRFFHALRAAGLVLHEHAFPDHHDYVAEDLQFSDDFAVLLTPKDAVKVRSLTIESHGIYEVVVSAKLDVALTTQLDNIVNRFANSTNQL